MLLLSAISILTMAMARDINYDDIKDGSYWSNPPTVQRCTDATTTMSVINEAVAFWREEGFKIAGVKSKKVHCRHDIAMTGARIGYIMITGAREKYVNARAEYAIMYPWYYLNTMNSDRRRWMSAIIITTPGYENNIITIKHEIGHALGLDHTSISGNPMYVSSR